jgi:hypothetical protein
MAAVSGAVAGRDDETRNAVGRLREIDPTTGISNFYQPVAAAPSGTFGGLDKGFRLSLSVEKASCM